ncbi:TonB-dependent receptor [Pedobacter hartonius]|uniref:Outer membrane receptor proteins, mostly Fe transport n=1 Tax=Pedobacter hartonius TaxID=425514 RepID=A0A1H4GSM1_9SPHI|nr:TonB-dependent receptor [Pedobacter hartonius]SEB12537.1 Outer membrane receptor proteins, mostly Fe transport [Pedobacter hartonius]
MKLQLQLKGAVITLLLLVMISAASFAQGTGKISGTISDKKTGETLIGVTVKLKGSTKGIATDVDGKYSITGLASGKYTVVYQYIGYTGKEISEVEVNSGKNTILNVILEESNSQNLNEVVIKGSFKKETINALYAQQKNNAAISDGISSELIKRSPDRNTSDVLKRVSGTTIQDNKFVVIRGLSDRYNAAMLDGSTLPSTEPNRKAFSFDIVPSNLVDNLIISKTATPDLPGDFAGGAIQITTKDIPEQNFISFGVGAGYNTASTFKDFKSGTRNLTDYLGFDNGDKKLGSKFPSTTRINNGLTPAQNISALKAFPRDWKVYNFTALPTQNYQFTIGRVKDLKNNRKFGALVSLTYRNAQTINNDVKRQYYDFDYNDDVYKFSTNIGALANFAYTFGKNKITFKNIYNRIYEDQFLYRTGVNQAISSDIQFYAFDLMQKSLLKSTVEGDHQLGERNAKLNWSVSFSNVLNDQPDQKKLNYARTLSADPSTPYSANITTLGRENARLFSRMNENSYTGAVNYSLPVTLFNTKATFKTGLSALYRDRTFDVRFLGATVISSDISEQIRQRPINTLYSTSLINGGNFKVEELYNKLDQYTANSLTNAGYAMLDNKIGEKARLVWGVRVEQFNVNLTPEDAAAEKVKQNYADVLPSANFTYSLTDKINLRASYYRTIARPEFRELSVSTYYDYETLSNLQGNPNLKRSNIDNADIRFELYPQAGQIISVSGFYKKFKNAIETFNNDATSTRTVTYFNSDKATVYGAEFEIRKSLEFIRETDFLKNTTAYANVSIIKSKVTNDTNTGLNNVEGTRVMVGQAPYVINAGLLHSFLDNKFTFNALYNKVGRRLAVAAGSLYPSIWEAPRDVIDLQLGMKMLKNKGELKFNAGDILNQKTTFYYDMNTNKKYDGAPGDYTVSSFKAGSNFSVAFSYTF